MSLPPANPARTLGIYKSGFNYEIRQGGSSGPLIYYVNNSSWIMGTPNVQILGGDKHGPMVASAKFHKVSADIDIALGDATDERNPTFYRMTKESLMTHREYAFETAEGPTGQRQQYLWKKDGLGGDFVATDSNGQIVAYFEKTGMAWSKVGKICYTADRSTQNLELMLLVSLMGIYQAQVKRQRSNAAAAGGST